MWRLLTSLLLYAGYIIIIIIIISYEPTEGEGGINLKHPKPSFKHKAVALNECHVKRLAKQHGFNKDDVEKKTSGLLGHSDLIEQLPLKTCPLAQLSASDCHYRVEHLMKRINKIL